VQSIAGIGTSGQLLTSNGPGALPTFQTYGGGAVLPLSAGGTNANLTANNGGIFYSTASAAAILNGTATAGQLLLSGATASPSWSTTTYPNTNAINTLLYASAANTMSALPTSNSGVLITSGSGVPSINSTLPTVVQNNITQTGNLASGSLVSGFTAVTVPLGGTGDSSFTAYSVICGGTSTTGALQNVLGVGSVGYSLTSQGAGALPKWASNTLKSFTILTSGTAAIYTTPAGINNLLIEAWGGGGAGGGAVGTAVTVGAGGGGGSGAYSRNFTTSPAATYTYTVGAAGTPGAVGNNPGGNGGSTTFDSLVTAGGGTGGSGDAGSANSHFTLPGAGGTASSGIYNAAGQPGQYGFTSLIAYGIGGSGGNTSLGMGGGQFASSAADSNGYNGGTNTGGGGGGGISANTVASVSGGYGGSGLIIIWEFA
jgi:hypothetical protein